MNKILIFTILISNALSLKAQTDSFPQTLDFLTYWVKGDSIKYNIKKGKYKYKGEREEPSDSTIRSFQYLFVVKDSTKEGYLIEISLIPNLKNPNKSLDGFIENLDLKDIGKLIKYKDFKIRYNIDPNGKFLKFENIDEIIKFHRDIWDIYIAKMGKDNNAEQKKVLQDLKKTMTSPQAIESKTLQEFTQIHQYYGLSFQIDSLYEYEDEYPNLFEPNGKKIPTKNKFILTWTDNPEIAEIEGEGELDSVAVKNLVTQFLEKTLSSIKNKDSNKVKTEIEKLSMTVNDYHYYRFHAPTGWIYEFVRTRRTKANDIITVEFFEMNMVLDDE